MGWKRRKTSIEHNQDSLQARMTDRTLLEKCSAGVALLVLQLALFSSLPTMNMTANCETRVSNERYMRDHVNIDSPSRRGLSELAGGDDSALKELSLTYHPSGTSMHSSIHCVGENFGPDAWMYRLCQFRNLCFDTDRKDFVVFPSSHEIHLQRIAKLHKSTVTISTLMSSETSSMSIGSPNREYDAYHHLKWFPRVVEQTEISHSQGYYTLPTNFVLLPFHAISNVNPTHLIWNDIWPLFVLLQTFGLSSKQVVALNYTIPNQPANSDACMLSQSNAAICKGMFLRYGAVFGNPRSLLSIEEFLQEISNLIQEKKSPIVCAPFAGAGMGMMSDNSAKHLKRSTSSLTAPTHNHGQGGIVLDFSRYLLQNLGLEPRDLSMDGPRKVIFAIDALYLNEDVKNEINNLKKGFVESQAAVTVHMYVMETLPVLEQATIVVDASVFVSVGHSGAAAAIFMSPGSSLIVLNSKGEVLSSSLQKAWDFLSDATYLRFHWLTFGEDTVGKGNLGNLVQSELDYLHEEKRSSVSLEHNQ